MEEKQTSPIGDTWEDFKREIEADFTNDKIKWGYELEKHKDAFLLGANMNIGKYYKKYYGYICIYLGFWTLSFGKDYFD